MPSDRTKEKKGEGKGKGKVRRYITQDNGGEPFLVEDDGKKVIVYKQDFDEKKKGWVPKKKVLDSPYKRIFVGDDPMRLSPYWRPSFRGNSILLQVSSTKHIFIGDRIFSFEPVKGDNIQRYISIMGNSSVPYPYAIGKTHTYLMIEHAYIDNKVLDLKKDVYAQYYGFESSNEERKRVEKATRPLKERTIVKRVVG